MRAYEGQQSDRVPLRRTPAEKRRQLEALKHRLSIMRSHESADLKASITAKIAELEKELGVR